MVRSTELSAALRNLQQCTQWLKRGKRIIHHTLAELLHGCYLGIELFYSSALYASDDWCMRVDWINPALAEPVHPLPVKWKTTDCQPKQIGARFDTEISLPMFLHISDLRFCFPRDDNLRFTYTRCLKVMLSFRESADPDRQRQAPVDLAGASRGR